MNSAPKAHPSRLQILRSYANNWSMQNQNPTDILNQLTSQELRDRLRQLQAEEKSLKILLRAIITRERKGNVRLDKAEEGNHVG